ncbi:MAG: hypothetical protein WCT41_03405 [Candidatus Paceibacterota bacterium]|jgi:hypothetical protein
MKDKVNSYFATLILLIAGLGAAWLIYRLATTNNLKNAVTGTGVGTEASYSQLQQSILKN